MMKERGGLARMWMVVLALALVVGPGVAAAGAADRNPGGSAAPGERVTAGDGAVESGHDLSSEGAAPNVDLPLGTDAGWWATVQEEIRQSEYEVTWQERTYLVDLPAAYQAPNRAHNLRTYFAPEGVRVIPRAFDGEAPSWEWGLALSGYGYAGALQPVLGATLHSEGNRIEYRRDTLTEWYVNDERGLEQGFTLHAPPEPAGEGEVVLELISGGNLSPQLAADGTAVELITAGGVRVLHYGELVVQDATGRDLAAWLEPGQETIRIHFDASGAHYPIQVDPLTTTPGWTADGAQVGAYFGWSVGTVGDVNEDGYSDVIVGAPYYDGGQSDEGRAYVYVGSPRGLSDLSPWHVESNQAGAHFGFSVGTAGDVNGDGGPDIVVGAPLYDNSETNEGRVYVYHGGADSWSTVPAWTADGGQAYASLGDSVGTAGDVNGDGYGDLIAGAYGYDNGQANEGRAFVYHGSATGLGASAAWTGESNQEGARYGSSVGTAGDVNGDGYSDVIVGAHLYDNGQVDEGRAYVYHGSPSGLDPSYAWIAESNQAEAHFGWSAGTAGDVDGDGFSDVIVGAKGYDTAEAWGGRAFVFLGTANGLTTSAAWGRSCNQEGARYGWSVGTAGDVNGDGFSDVIVGADQYDHPELNEGRVYVYLGSHLGLSGSPDWTAEGDLTAGYFGFSVGTAGDVNGDGYSDVIIGARNYDVDQTARGRAYVYHGRAGGPSNTPSWTAEGNQERADFGGSVGTAGDVNCDGYGDVIVGAPLFDNGEENEGRAYVYLGGSMGLATSPAWTAEGDQEGARYGFSVGTAGDVNGNGCSEVLVGAPFYDAGQRDEGRAYLYHGYPTGLSTVAPWWADGNEEDAKLGYSVGTAGDVNGDGYSDFVIGTPYYDGGQTDQGMVRVFHGAASGAIPAAPRTVQGGQDSALFGISVGTAGDVNGDGYSDVIVGAPGIDNGRAYVYHGSANSLATSPAWTVNSDQASSFGGSVGTAGDVNRDGYSDVIVGAPSYDNDQYREGRAYVFQGSAGGLSPVTAWMAEGDQDNARFGRSVGTAGDVNGDGYSDVIVGAYGYSNGEYAEGRAYVYNGSSGGLTAFPTWTAESDQVYAYFGMSVGTAGDVNGDGYSDVIVGAPDCGSVPVYEGWAYVYHGNGAGGLPALPQQRSSDDSTPIARLGMADDPTSFRISLIGRMPLGRADVKLQWYAAPATFYGGELPVRGTSPDWIDTGAGGAEISQLVTGLWPDTPYYWRVRLLYRPGNALGQVASRWIHIPWAGWREADLRTPWMRVVTLPLIVKGD